MNELEMRMRAILNQRDHANEESLRSLSQRMNVSYHKLVYWNRRLSDPVVPPTAAPDQPKMVEVKIQDQVAPSESRPSSFEITFPNDLRLHVHHGFDAEELSQLIRVLQSC